MDEEVTSPQADSRSTFPDPERRRDGKRTSISCFRLADAPRSVVGISRIRLGRFREVRISDWMERRSAKSASDVTVEVASGDRESDQPKSSTFVNS